MRTGSKRTSRQIAQSSTLSSIAAIERDDNGDRAPCGRRSEHHQLCIREHQKREKEKKKEEEKIEVEVKGAPSVVEMSR